MPPKPVDFKLPDVNGKYPNGSKAVVPAPAPNNEAAPKEGKTIDEDEATMHSY